MNVAASSDSDVAHPGHDTAVLGIQIIRPDTAPVATPVVITGELAADDNVAAANSAAGHAAAPTKKTASSEAAGAQAGAADAAGASSNASHAANASPAGGGGLPVGGGPEAAIALLAITFLAVGALGIARSRRFAKQHPSHAR